MAELDSKVCMLQSLSCPGGPNRDRAVDSPRDRGGGGGLSGSVTQACTLTSGGSHFPTWGSNH